METTAYFDLKKALIEDGYAHEIDWIANIKPCEDPIIFRNEAIWVIINSGMKEQIARAIYERIWAAYEHRRDISTAYRHDGKVKAIKNIMNNYPTLFHKYYNAVDKLEYLETLPFIGKITKYHLAKNLGLDCVKPDRHLVRLAAEYNFKDAFELCGCISHESGDKVSMVDMVLWRSANLGWI